jgi:hypothetical protein
MEDRKLLPGSQTEKGHKKGSNRALFAPAMVSTKPANSFGKNGGDDGTRTRDLCRDRAAF